MLYVNYYHTSIETIAIREGESKCIGNMRHTYEYLGQRETSPEEFDQMGSCIHQIGVQDEIIINKMNHLYKSMDEWKAKENNLISFTMIYFYFYFLKDREQERACTSKQGRGRGRGKEKILSRFHTSVEPHRGLANHEIMT